MIEFEAQTFSWLVLPFLICLIHKLKPLCFYDCFMTLSERPDFKLASVFFVLFVVVCLLLFLGGQVLKCMKFAQLYSHKHSLKTKLRGDMTEITDVFSALTQTGMLVPSQIVC